MNLVSVLGSCNPEGRTAKAADAFVQGATGSGGQSESVLLPELQLERCRQCEADGWGVCRTEGRCVIEDDFALLVEKIRNADAVVFATPVYFSDVSESIHAFLNRLRRTCMHDAGKRQLTDKPAVGICVAGGGGGGAPAAAVSLEKLLGRCGFDLVDVVPARRQNLDLKLEVLKATGQWLTQYQPPDAS